MDPSFVGVVRFDFFLNDDLDEVQGTLENIYRDEAKDDADPRFFGLAPETQLESRGTASVERYSTIDPSAFEGDPFSAFDELQTFLIHQDSRRFLDAITVATVSRDGIESLDNGETHETRNAIAGWQEDVSRIGERTGSIVFDDVFEEEYPLALHPTILYVDCGEDEEIWSEEGEGADESICREYVQDCEQFLLGEEGCVSAMASGEIIGTQQVGEVWGPLTAVKVAEPKEEYSFPAETEIDLPDIGTLVNRVTPFFRSFDWVHFRLQDLHIVEDELMDTTANVRQLERNDEREYLRTLLGEEEEVGRIQNYLDYSEMIQELEDINYLISEFDYDSSKDRSRRKIV